MDAHGFAARWDGAAILETAGRDDAFHTTTLPESIPGYQLCIADMLNAVHGGAAVDGSGSLGSIALLDAALASANDQGRAVPVPRVPEFRHAAP
ncbi:hypothetical protein AB0B45_15350 [Nonomuraea sp. NPDC049152]|uniref:hypothetical protein n=1 Tax=Nonomuraea sp. NPDC049152 TaxID=3154350 RepID=UPI0033CB4BCE